MDILDQIKQALSNKDSQYVHCVVQGCSSYVPRLHRHINRRHPSICPVACSSCPAKFLTNEDLKNHQRNGCPRGSRNRNQRKRNKNLSTTSKNTVCSWQCESCRKSFGSESALNQHKKDKQRCATSGHSRIVAGPSQAVQPNFDEIDFSSSSSVSNFISQNLQLDKKYKQDVLKAVNALAKTLKTHMKAYADYGYSVNRFVKAGSIGKGTAVKEKSDIDCVIFFNNFKTAKEHKDNLQKTKNDLKTCLEKHCNSDSLSSFEFLGETRFAVKIKAKLRHSGRSFDVDLLPTFNAGITQRGRRRRRRRLRRLRKRKLYNDLLNKEKEERQFYSAALVQLQVRFVSNQPANVKDLIRLVKFWRKSRLKDEGHLRLPTSYPLELITIHCWEKAGKPKTFDPRLGFKAVLEQLKNYTQLRAVWFDNYDKDLAEKGEMHQSSPMVLDPANPANNVCNASDTQGWEQVALAAIQELDDPQLEELHAGSNWQLVQG